jgi:soluble lytic murein transglycosylase-like protein/thioredoxin-like negative regulator of GroEL
MIEGNYFVFDKTGSQWIILTLSALLLAGCSSRTSTPKSSTDNATTPKKTTSSKSPNIEKTVPQHYEINSFFIGRALELGEIEKAKSLATKPGTDAPSLLVSARLASEIEDFETAVRIYHQMTDAEPAFERMRIESLADALAAVGRHGEAVAQLQSLVEKGAENDQEIHRLLIKQAAWLRDNEPEKSVQLYKKALSLAAKPSVRDATSLAIGTVLLNAGQHKEASQLLEKLALEASSANIMKKALSLLQARHLAPKWSSAQHLSRAKTLMKHRAFDAALESLKPVFSTADRQEAEWVKANILFKRRRHYKEAGKALAAIVKAGGPHADEARFLAARALSRQDRDMEAIKAYRAFAAKTERPERGNYARFLAARLEFYLGRHKQALDALEWLVGNGKAKRRRRRLSAPDDRRDAHFLAGLSAVLLDQPRRAIPHLTAASDGTNHPEVLRRNAYWHAVASAMKKSKDAKKLFWRIWETDPTEWYARMSASRLSKMGSDLGPCRLTPLTIASTRPTDIDAGPTSERRTQLPDFRALREISPLVALFAQAGLFKDASRALKAVEKEGIIKRPAGEWIRHYISLEAPHHAIRRASREFEWPPTPENMEMVRAAYPRPYEALVREVEAKHGLPEDLIFAIARKESLFDPHAVSWVGAMGMMQMMPRTYEANRKKAGLPPLKEGELPGPAASIKAAGEEFAYLFEKFNGSLPLAVMAYNGGVAAVSRWVDRSGGLPLDVFVEKIGFTQTRNYVRRVTKNLMRYRLLAGNPVPLLPRVVKQ